MKHIKFYALPLLIASSAAFSQNDGSTMNHSTHSVQMAATEPAPQTMTMTMATLPTEAGSDAFGTIQEIITLLNDNPDTDWKKVDIEALRRHLVDMQDMTMNVNVLSQEAIPNGLFAVIEPSTPRAADALERVMKAHPAQLAQETGWRMEVNKRGRRFALTITTDNTGDVDKIRGLGYIGLMAYGAHHQPHHWAMATGTNPHKM